MIAIAWMIPLAASTLAIGPPIASPGRGVSWEADSAGRVVAVSLTELSSADVEAIASWPESRRAGLLVVTVDGVGADLPAILGSYRIEKTSLRFTPSFPLDRGRRYRATTHPEGLPGGGVGFSTVHSNPKPPRAATSLTRIDPAGDVLPENLLKFYLHFSAPMARGEAYEHLAILDGDGRPVLRPFLELGEELWDRTGTRLTVLLDPGRIKRGLKPREEFGPILVDGRFYTLVVDPGWRDAEGDPLASIVRKAFRAGPADEGQPDPSKWTVARPAPSTRDPITLNFPEPLDRALLESGLCLLDPKGEPVSGRAEVQPGATRWRFTPDRPWAAGEYILEIDADLEDLAGNSIRRPFEVDIQRDTPVRPEPKAVRLPIIIR